MKQHLNLKSKILIIGLYQASDDDIQKEIDGRKKLLEEAENLYTPVKLQKINKNEEINSKFKSLIVRRKT